jgi:uncharacterized membrane protein YhaH (DUF805 family)
MNFGQAIASGFANYVNFSGRAVRSEYWYWVLFTILGAIVTSILDAALFSFETVSPLNSVFNVITFLPSLAVLVRRLHDIDRTGWWVLIGLTGIGLILLIYWACQPGTPGPNRFGPDPFGSGRWVSPPRPA